MTSKKLIVVLLILVVLSSKITVVDISLGLSLLALVAGFLWHRKRKYIQDVHRQTSDGSKLICKQVNSKTGKLIKTH